MAIPEFLGRQRRAVGAGVLAAVVVAGVILALAGGDGEGTATTSAAAEPTTTTAPPPPPPPPPTAPLTGLVVEDHSVLQRPAVVVKIDNVEPAARPQAGLNEADVVYEARVEGGVTRLLAVFHSTDSVPVGPVRSARSSDVGLFAPLNRPIFAWSGANPSFARQLRAAPMVDGGIDAAPGHFFRERSRRAPSNLMARSTADLRGLVPDGGPPPALFEYLAEGEAPPGLEPVTHLRIAYGGAPGARVEYRWNGSGWARYQAGTPHLDPAGAQVAPANVIVQFTHYASSGVHDKFGVPIPEAQLVGEGEAWVLTRGGMLRGRWAKPALEAVTSFTDAAGQPLRIAPGRTWVALPEPGTAQVLG